MGRNLGLGALPALSGRAWGSLAGAPEGPRAGRFQHLGELRPSPDPAGSVLRYQALALLPRSETAVFGPRQGRNRPLHPSPEACLPKLFEHKHPINHKTAGSFPGKTNPAPPSPSPKEWTERRSGVGKLYVRCGGDGGGYAVEERTAGALSAEARKGAGTQARASVAGLLVWCSPS